LLSAVQLINAQDKKYTAKEALAIFKDGDYVEAEKAYAYLLKSYDRQIKYNYYYGICLIQNNHDLSQAVKRLKYAALKGVSRDAYYYLGRAYQLTYQFEEAVKNYSRFLKYASASDIRNANAEKYKTESEFGLQQAAKIYHLDVYARDTVANEAILSAYSPSKDVGKVTVNEEFFTSGLDPQGILYLTERGDEVYFSMLKEEQGSNLYKMEKLLDGWSKSVPLEGINTEADEIQPYVLIDGATIYFSSNRDGGFGGYDLYRASYDAESKAYSEPVNLGIPFNSPKDDYLFAADEFNQVAWFASNRETNDSTLIVYTMKWDDSVVKNFVQDINEVRRVAALELAENGDWSMQGNGTNKTVREEEKDNSFRFVIADTLEYSQLEHFKSDEASAIYSEGLKLQAQKDSLSLLMKQKRTAYARTNSETERSMLVNDILLLEKEVYGLDEKVERTFFDARLKEQDKIKELVAAGRYTSSTKVKVKKDEQLNYNEILIPDEYTFYTDEEFARELEELDVMYHKLFTEDEINKLNHADSLFVWGNILNLESSKIHEGAADAPQDSESLVSLIRGKDSVEEQSNMQSQLDKAKELKIISLKLYHESLDAKYKIYEAKLKQTLLSNTVDDLQYLEDAQLESKEYYKEASELIKRDNGFDLLLFEKSGAIKRNGVKVQENGLVKYSEVPANELNEEIKPSGSVPKTYQELQGMAAEEKPEKTAKPSEVVAGAFNKEVKTKLEYKIQIGVFRNEPNASAVAKIPPISKVKIPNKELTKYFAGSYTSYSEAQKDLPAVNNAGFNGAFVVVFKDGKQINLTEELKK